MKKILFILSGNLSTTPRALKIIESYKDEVQIDILAIKRSRTWANLDNEYQKKHNLNLNLVSISKRNLLPWIIASIIHQIAKWIYPFFKQNLRINSFASEKASIFLWIALDNYSSKYDLVASFSYGSIYPASNYAKSNKFPLVIDIEDYHVGEKIALADKNEQNRRTFIVKECLPSSQLLTYASPLIGMHTLNLLKKNHIPQHRLINNSFSLNEFVFKQNISDKIKFVWFSQTVDYGRGLELIIPALAKFHNHVELHIIGKMNAQFEQDVIIPNDSFIKSHNALSQKKLNLILSDFDIGLAIETSKEDSNRDICLTNKIFAYAQAGLFILATDTQAQNLFISNHKDIGLTTRYELNDMSNKITTIVDNINQIRTLKANRFQYAKKMAWEQESLKVKETWTTLINKNTTYTST